MTVIRGERIRVKARFTPTKPFGALVEALRAIWVERHRPEGVDRGVPPSQSGSGIHAIYPVIAIAYPAAMASSLLKPARMVFGPGLP